MKPRNWMHGYLIALPLIGLVGACSSDAFPVRAAFGVGAVISGYAYIRMEKALQRETMQARLDKQQQANYLDLLQTVNHLRHDWMNDIQVLFGYIQLKKYDNLHTYVEKIKATMQQESFLSKLGIPSLIAYLLAFRAHSKHMRLEIGLEQEINLQQLPLDAGLITHLVQNTVEAVEQYASPEAEEVGVLSLEFDVQEDHLLLDFVYQGEYDRDGLKEELGRKFPSLGTGAYEMKEQELGIDEAVIAIRLPYRT